MKSVFALVRRYAAAEDPRVAAANLVALVLAWNTPFYPLYLLGAAGAAMGEGAWLTLCAFPVFVAVPAITRWNGTWGRGLLVAAGTGNTLFCTWLLGEASGTALFLLPCITLAALLFRRSEIWALFPFLVLPIVAGIAMDGRYPFSPFACAAAACSAIAWLNAVSVAILLAFLGILATGMAEPGHYVRPASVDVRPTRQ
jgi:hypothetical protein